MALTGTGYGVDPEDGYTSAAINTYYLDEVNGDDITGEGTFLLPWKTIVKVQTVMDSGDLVLMRDGSYSQFSEADPTPRTDWVTFRAEHSWSLPVVSGFSLINTSLTDNYLRFDGVDFIVSTNELYIGTIEFVRRCEVRNSNINNSTHKYLTDSCLRIADSDTILIYGNDTSAASRSATITNTANFTYSKNHIHGLSGSSPINYGAGNTNGIIERNNIYDSNFDTQDVDPNSPYLIGSPGGWPHSSGVAIRSNDLIIRGNIFHDVGSTAGISTYVPDAAGGETAYNDILIENNLLYDIQNNSVLQISNLGSNFVVRNNTIVSKERTDNSNCPYKLYTAIQVHQLGSGADGSGLSLINNIMIGTCYLPDLCTTDNNLFWAQSWDSAPSTFVLTSNDVDTVISTNSGTHPSCPYTDFTSNFFTGITSLADFTAGHGLVKDFTLDPLSDAINFGDSSLQSLDSLGAIDGNGFIQVPPVRDSLHHSAGAYEYGVGTVTGVKISIERYY